MKVVYVNPIQYRLNDAIKEADAQQKQIEYIELTPSEWYEMEAMFAAGCRYVVGGVYVTTYNGVSLRKAK